MNTEQQNLFLGATDAMRATVITIMAYFVALNIPLLLVFRELRVANIIYELEIIMCAFASVWAIPFAIALALLFVGMVWWDLSRIHGFFWTIICQCICMAAYEDIESYVNKWLLIGLPIIVYAVFLGIFMAYERRNTCVKL